MSSSKSRNKLSQHLFSHVSSEAMCSFLRSGESNPTTQFGLITRSNSDDFFFFFISFWDYSIIPDSVLAPRAKCNDTEGHSCIIIKMNRKHTTEKAKCSLVLVFPCAGTTQSSTLPTPHRRPRAPTSPAPVLRATTRWRPRRWATRTHTLRPATTPRPPPWRTR